MWTVKYQISLIYCKSQSIKYLITNRQTDLFCFTEIWLQQEEYVSLNETTPQGHFNYHVPRSTARGGGVVAIFHSS